MWPGPSKGTAGKGNNMVNINAPLASTNTHSSGRVGATVGGVVGALATCGLVIVAVGVFLWVRNKRQNAPKSSAAGFTNVGYMSGSGEIKVNVVKGY